MCVKLEVILPTIEKFLFLYSIRGGCVLILIWTIFRALFCLLFFILAILEILVKQQLPFGALMPKLPATSPTNTILLLYALFLIMVLTEALLLAFTFFLLQAVCQEKTSCLVTYLTTRTLTWPAEVTSLILLCVLHKLLIGWYLGFLFFIILELYAWVVVYSYYCELELSKELVCANDCPLNTA